MHILRPLCLVVLLITAGCAVGPFTGPSEQNQPVTFVLDNSANVTQTFNVFVVRAPAKVKAKRADGITGNYTVGQGLRSHSSGPYAWTKVELPNSAQLHGWFTVEPGKKERGTIEEFSQNSAVVVVLYQDGNISGWWASAYCSDGALVGLEVHTRPSKYGDAWAGYECAIS